MKKALSFMYRTIIYVITVSLCIALVACGGNSISLTEEQQSMVNKHNNFVDSLNNDNVYDEFTDTKFIKDIVEMNGVIIYIVKVIYDDSFYSVSEEDYVNEISDTLYSALNLKLSEVGIEAVVLLGPEENDIQYRMGKTEITEILDQNGYFD